MSVTSASSTMTNTWIACPYPKPETRLRLFCFPYAGSGTSVFHPWARLLRPEIELCPIRLPGREGRLKEAPYEQIQLLVETLAGAVLPSLEKPFAFFGHSMGAIIAFELTRQLRRQQVPMPVYLFASGHDAPHLVSHPSPLYNLPDDEFANRVRDRYKGIPTAIWANSDLMALFLPTLRADFTLIETYVYSDEPKLDIPMMVLGGCQDGETSQAGLDGWRKQTQSVFKLKMFAGDHFFLQSERHALLETINQELSRFLY